MLQGASPTCKSRGNQQRAVHHQRKSNRTSVPSFPISSLTSELERWLAASWAIPQPADVGRATCRTWLPLASWDSGSICRVKTTVPSSLTLLLPRVFPPYFPTVPLPLLCFIGHWLSIYPDCSTCSRLVKQLSAKLESACPPDLHSCWRRPDRQELGGGSSVLIKTLTGGPCPPAGVPGSSTWLYSQLQLPANGHPGRQQMTGSRSCSLSPAWET